MAADPRLRARARAAYELGRVRYAVPWGIVSAVLVFAAAALLGGSRAAGCLLAAAAFALMLVAHWRGRAFHRAALPGAVAGLLAYAATCCEGA